MKHCRDCGSGRCYVTSLCNFAHCGDCGAAWDEDHDECYADPCMIALERRGDLDSARRVQAQGCYIRQEHDPREHDAEEWEEE